VRGGTLLGTCLACLSRALADSSLFFSYSHPLAFLPVSPSPLSLSLSFSLSLSLLLLLSSLRAIRAPLASRRAPISPPFRPQQPPGFLRPFRIRSEGLGLAKLRNRVTQPCPLPRGKHTTRVLARNIAANDFKEKGKRRKKCGGHRGPRGEGGRALIP